MSRPSLLGDGTMKNLSGVTKEVLAYTKSQEMSVFPGMKGRNWATKLTRSSSVWGGFTIRTSRNERDSGTPSVRRVLISTLCALLIPSADGQDLPPVIPNFFRTGPGSGSPGGPP